MASRAVAIASRSGAACVGRRVATAGAGVAVCAMQVGCDHTLQQMAEDEEQGNQSESRAMRHGGGL